MSDEPPEPKRKVNPYKPGKRVSTFRRLDLDFAGTALEQALAQRDLLEKEDPPFPQVREEAKPTNATIHQLPSAKLKEAGFSSQSGGYTPPLVATNLATEQPMVATNVATHSTGGYTDTQSGGYTPSRRGDRHKNSQKEQFNIRLDKDKIQKIKELCVSFRLNKQEFWDLVATRIIELVATDVATLSLMFPGLVATNVAHDDMMTFQTHDDIIMRYQHYTGQKWTRRDDREGQKYNTVEIQLIEIALILTIERKLRGNTAKQPIKSFSYFTQEIDLILEQKRNGELPSAIDEYYKYVLSTWEKRIQPLRDAKWGTQNPAK